MRIKDALGPTLKPLNEALRMTSEMKRIADSSANEFRFGVEYEFHVNTENNFDIETAEERVREDSDAMDIVQNRIIEQITRELRPSFRGLFNILADLFDSDLNELIENRKDFKDAANVGSDDEESQEKFLSDFEGIVNTFARIRDQVDARPEQHSELATSVGLDIAQLREASKEAMVVEFPITYKQMTNLINNGDVDAIARSVEDLYELEFEENSNGTELFNQFVDLILQESTQDPNVEEFYQEIENNEVERYIDDMESNSASDFEDLKEIVERQIEERDIEDKIEDITPDGSVEQGVEVITKPLSFSDTIYTMKQMFEIIDEYGYTSDRTGMHVNISHASFRQGESIDPLKLSALMDVEYFQGRSEGGIVKYDMRNEMVRSTFYEINQPMLVDVATAYIRNGVEGMEEKLRSKLIGRGNKYRDINWTSLIGEFNSATRRIEFRFFGGRDYEDRLREIAQDLKYIMAVVKVITDDSFAPQDYYKGLIRILTRATRRVAQQEGKYFPYREFSEVVQAVKKGDVISGLDRNDALNGIMSDFS